jgi:hypothetical protein
VRVIDQENVVINIGSNEGIKRGNRFIIFGVGDEIIDPDSKESLGKLEIVRGEGIVVHVQEKMCIVRSDEYVSEPPTTEIRTYQNPLRGLTYLGRTTEEKKVIKSGKKTLIEFRGVEEGDMARVISSR